MPNLRLYFAIISKHKSKQKVASFSMLWIAIITLGTSGCGGRASQMAQLKRKLGAGNLPENKATAKDDAPQKNLAAAQPSNSPRSKIQSAGKPGEKPADNTGSAKKTATLNSLEAQNPKSAHSSADGFIQFRKSMIMRLNERRASLNPYQKRSAVARAFGEYVKNKRQFPSATINGKRCLSWRVELLPFLGYPDLYAMFDIESRYNSPLNNRLIDLMPPEYETTSSKGKTTLLAPVSSFTAYWSDKPTSVLRLEDGVSDTVGIVDVDASKAVTWTRPVDLEIKPGKEIFLNLGGNHDGQFVVIFGDGRMEKVSITSPPRDFMAMLSYDRGDTYPANISAPVEESDFIQPRNQPTALSTPDKTTLPNANSIDTAATQTTQPVASNRTSWSSNDSPKNQYSARLKQLEIESLLNGDQATAIELNFARLLIQDDSAGFSNYLWCKALQRPATALRWQIGISLANPDDKTDPVKRTVSRQITTQRPGTKTLETKAGQIGLDSAIILRNLVDDGLMGKVIQEHSAIVESNNQDSGSGPDTNNARNNLDLKSTDEELFDSRKQPDLHHSGVEIAIGSSRRYQLQVARERGIDLLLLLEIELRRIRNKKMNITTIYVIDVQRGKELMKSVALNNLKIEQDRKNALKQDAVFTAMQKLDKFARENIALSSFPQNIGRGNVLKRLALLIAKKENNVLKYIAEGRLYQEKGLLSDDDYKKFCQRILKDPEAGLAMAIGAPKYRLDVLKSLLPKKLNLNFQ